MKYEIGNIIIDSSLNKYKIVDILKDVVESINVHLDSNYLKLKNLRI